MNLLIATITVRDHARSPFIAYKQGDGWTSLGTGMNYPVEEVTSVDPMILIDPRSTEDRREVEFALDTNDSMPGLLRALTPKVKPDEPKKYGAIVRDGAQLFQRASSGAHPINRPWLGMITSDNDRRWCSWSALSDNAEIVFEGV